MQALLRSRIFRQTLLLLFVILALAKAPFSFSKEMHIGLDAPEEFELYKFLGFTYQRVENETPLAMRYESLTGMKPVAGDFAVRGPVPLWNDYDARFLWLEAKRERNKDALCLLLDPQNAALTTEARRHILNEYYAANSGDLMDIGGSMYLTCLSRYFSRNQDLTDAGKLPTAENAFQGSYVTHPECE